MSQTFRITTRFALYQRNARVNKGQMTCVYCGCDLDPNTATLDHVVPRVRDGHNGPSNIVVACGTCNSRKRNTHLSAWLRSLVAKAAWQKAAHSMPAGSTLAEVEEEAERVVDEMVATITARVRAERRRDLHRWAGRALAVMYGRKKVKAA